MVQYLFVLSNKSLLLLDQKSLAVKYRIPLTEVEDIKLSPYHDQIVFFHLIRVRKTCSASYCKISTFP